MIHRVPWREYQKVGLAWLAENSRCALWLWMGGGKTLITYASLVERFDAADVRRVLIVAPKRVIEMAWPEEAVKWRVPLRVVPLVGGPAERKAALARPADVNLISFDNLGWLFENMKAARRFDGIVIDESSKLKDHASRRFKLVRKYCKRYTLMWQLTGTPAANNYLGLYTQIGLLDGGAALGSTVTAFRERWFVQDYTGYRFNLRDGAKEAIQQRIKHLALSLDGIAELNLPPRTDRTITVRLSEQERSDYRTLERESLLPLTTGETVAAANAAVLAGKLRQYTSGAVFEGEGDARQWHEVGTAKLDALESIIEELNGDPVLVAYEYQHDRERIQKRFPKTVVLKTKKQFDAWNRGEIQIALAHPRSMGHGLNLQHGGRNIVWYTLAYSNDDYKQFNARLDRQGQTRPVFVCHLVAEDTVDEEILLQLHEREREQVSLMQALRARAKKCLL